LVWHFFLLISSCPFFFIPLKEAGEFISLLKKLDLCLSILFNNISKCCLFGIYSFSGGNLATHISALKRARQSKRRHLRNTRIKSIIKTFAKKVVKAVEEKNLEEAQKALTAARPIIQKAASQKVIHKKTAARKISRLARKVNALAAQA